MRWLLLAAVIVWLQTCGDRELLWSVRVRCEDARGEPVRDATFQVHGMPSCQDADAAFDGEVYTLEFRLGDHDSIGELIGGSRKRGLRIEAISPAHGRLRRALATEDPLRIVFPDPAWLTVTFDPVPNLAERVDLVLAVVPRGPDAVIREDRDLSEHMAEDGKIRIGPLVPGDYDVHLAEYQYSDGGKFYGFGRNDPPRPPDLTLESGENEYVLRHAAGR
ncbi:MAG: hypothetical protein HY812_08255 [Planctomycetes bacterium]|nr:hypothetical protein [Planctomycetota bacterium]